MKKMFKNSIIVAIVITIFNPLITEAAKRGKLAKVLSPNMLSVDVAYFEQIAGIARKTYENIKIYDIDGCEVAATITKGAIEALRIDLSPKCTFDLNKFLDISPQNFPQLYNMTFGQFDALTYNSGEFMVDCLYGCGNAAEPIVYEYKPGVHVGNWIEIMLEASTAKEDAYQAFAAWRDAMEKGEGEKWVWDKTRAEMLHCNPKNYETITHNAFKNVKISAITVGYNLSKAQCQ